MDRIELQKLRDLPIEGVAERLQAARTTQTTIFREYNPNLSPDNLPLSTRNGRL